MSTRLTLSKKEAECEDGRRLISLISQSIQDGDPTNEQIITLHQALYQFESPTPACVFLRELIENLDGSGEIENKRREISWAIHRILPKQSRESAYENWLTKVKEKDQSAYEAYIVSRSAAIKASAPPPPLKVVPLWHFDAPTEEQIAFIKSLGGVFNGTTKGDASLLIGDLLAQQNKSH